jgi:hypothetical protein
VQELIATRDFENLVTIVTKSEGDDLSEVVVVLCEQDALSPHREAIHAARVPIALAKPSEDSPCQSP